MEKYSIAFLIVAFAFGLISSVFETHSIYARTSVNANEKMAMLGYIAWVQYVSRIFMVMSTGILIFSFEKNISYDLRLYLICMMVGSMLLLIVQTIGPNSIKFVNALTGLFSFFNYRKEYSITYYKKPTKGNIQIVIYATIIYTLLTAASYFPLLLANSYPDYRMSLGFLSQIGNFIGTTLFYGIIEPKYLKGVDCGIGSSVAFGMLYGKSVALIIILLMLFNVS
jgi:hypothetical protein